LTEAADFGLPHLIDVRTVKPYEHNARTHDREQIEQLKGVIRLFGFVGVIAYRAPDELKIGHGRQIAVTEMWEAGETVMGPGKRAPLPKWQVPAVDVTGLSDEECRALVIADNKIAENAGWDEEKLRAEIEALQLADFEIPTIGFDEAELARLFRSGGGRTDPDEVPEAPAVPTSRAGDVWLMGDHRLVCGDSMDAATLALALDGQKADLIFTSPPYAVGVDYGEEYQDTIENLRAMLAIAPKMWAGVVEPGGFAAINFGDIINGREIAGAVEPCEYPMAVEYWPAFRKAGWVLFTRRIWQKPHARVHSPWAIKSCRAASDWEHLWTWKLPGKPITARGESSAFGIWDTSEDHGVDIGKEVHGAGMAVGLVTRALETHSRDGRIVLEPYSGTCTTIIGAEMIGRRCRAIEISPSYTDIAVLRWQAYTGRDATLASSGQTYAQARSERLPDVSG
jgi:DNA modification methylase